MVTRIPSAALVAALALLGLALAHSSAAQPPAKQDSPRKTQQPIFPDLGAALKATPGCLGVESARTASGKQVIFAWFENKKAVLKWYHSDVHKKVMRQFFPDLDYTKPLKDVPDDTGPIMAIASITFSDKNRVKETSLPISQIAIELYTPLSGGLHLGGRFAPDALKVPNIQDYTPKK
jgi:hypothetical protein